MTKEGSPISKVVLVWRLAWRDLARRRGQAVLLLIVMTAAMGTLTLGLVLHGVTSKPFSQTKRATAGPDVVASTAGYARSGGQSAAAAAQLAALARAPGVTAHSGPYPVAWPVLAAPGVSAYVMAEGRAETIAGVDQPEVIEGSWVRPGGVVLERAFAQSLGARVGERVTLGGRPFHVIGIAVTAAVPVYSQVCFYGGCSGPGGQPRSPDTGLAWVTASAARSLAAPGNPVTYYLNLRLADPAAAPAFARAHQLPEGSGPAALTAWQSLQAAAATIVAQGQRVLQPASWLLAVLAAASVALVTGGRMTEQERRVGLLKAAGGTPPLVAAVLLAEHLLIAILAAAAGLAAGWLAAPLLASPGASLVGSPATPPLTPATGVIVVAAAVVVAAVSTLIPAIRAARISTVAGLASTIRAPRRLRSLIRLSAWLPAPLLLGLRLLGRRPRRALLSGVGFTVTGAAIVAVLVFHATVASFAGRPGQPGPADPGTERVGQVLLAVTVVMAALAAANALFITYATVADSRRFWAIARSLGATARQTAAGLAVAQLLPALAGILLGIPAGEGLYGLVQGAGPQGSPPAWSLVAVVAGALVAVAGLAALPARAAARRPVAELLTQEG
ncbi:MAG TPA: FtsX-like permease family protein [Streptosporangiaceae bacterium]